MGAKMDHWDVKFYSMDKERVFFASFRSEELADKFIERFQHAGEFRRFEYDHYGLNDFSGNIQIVPCNINGFRMVMQRLGQLV